MYKPTKEELQVLFDEYNKLYFWDMLGKCVMWTDQVLKEVLVHEMIHMYNTTIESERCDGLLGHGRRFRRQRRRLMKEHGLKISIHDGYEFIDDRPEPALWEKVILWIIDR